VCAWLDVDRPCWDGETGNREEQSYRKTKGAFHFGAEPQGEDLACVKGLSSSTPLVGCFSWEKGGLYYTLSYAYYERRLLGIIRFCLKILHCPELRFTFAPVLSKIDDVESDVPLSLDVWNCGFRRARKKRFWNRDSLSANLNRITAARR
jgi:hypothetical protein